MGDMMSTKKRRPQRRGRTRWNYKRIGIALVILVAILGMSIYAGFTLAHKFAARPEKEKVAGQSVDAVTSIPKPPPTTTTTGPKYIKHTVEQGDSYYGLALKYNTSVKAIKDLNGVADEDNFLQIDMVLKIPVKGAAAIGIDNKKPQVEDEEDTTVDEQEIEVSPKEISNGPTDRKRVALTFDAGASSEATSRILQALEDADVKGTFFLSGKWVEENPELAKKIADQNHRIGNHTYSHPDLTKSTDNEIVNQLKKTEEVINEITGVSTKPIFRTPYGARDARVLRIAANTGYRSIYWTIDSLDWKPTMKSDQVKNRVLAGLSNGAIILLHCGSNQTAEILPDLIKEIESRGYEIVTVPELFK